MARIVLLGIQLLGLVVAFYALIRSWQAWEEAQRTSERVERICRGRFR